MFKSLRYTNKIKTVFAYHKNEDDFHVGSGSQKHNRFRNSQNKVTRKIKVLN